MSRQQFIDFSRSLLGGYPAIVATNQDRCSFIADMRSKDDSLVIAGAMAVIEASRGINTGVETPDQFE